MTPDTWPYCQHPECHNPRTVEYWTGGTGLPPTKRYAAQTAYTRDGWPGVHRWCRSHALLNEGWAVS